MLGGVCGLTSKVTGADETLAKSCYAGGVRLTAGLGLALGRERRRTALLFEPHPAGVCGDSRQRNKSALQIRLPTLRRTCGVLGGMMTTLPTRYLTGY